MFFGASWWEALSAIGTVAAVVVALLLATIEGLRARRAEKALEHERSTQAQLSETRGAGLVSAWVEITATPSESGRHYERRAVVHVANESDQPVYNVGVRIGIPSAKGTWTSVGPLSVPLPVPVLAARSHQAWDATLPLLASTPDLGNFVRNPTAAISFSDPSGQQWVRDFDLVLKRESEQVASPTSPQLEAEEGEEQLGQLDNPYNPLAIVLAFLAAVSKDDGPDLKSAKSLLDPAARGWGSMTDGDFVEGAKQWASLGVAAHVHYPAPRVAYVKTLTDEDADQRGGGSQYVEVPVVFFTLRYLRGYGWRIFGIGSPTRVDQIPFPEADLLSDIRVSEGPAERAVGNTRRGEENGY